MSVCYKLETVCVRGRSPTSNLWCSWCSCSIAPPSFMWLRFLLTSLNKYLLRALCSGWHKGSRSEVLLISDRTIMIRDRQWKELDRSSRHQTAGICGPVTFYLFLSSNIKASNVEPLPSLELVRQQGQPKGEAPGFLPTVSFCHYINKKELILKCLNIM